jgi:hypothetical protein
MADKEAGAVKVAVVPKDMDKVVEQWFADHFPNSQEVAGYTPAWNKVTEAVADLKKRLKEV